MIHPFRFILFYFVLQIPVFGICKSSAVNFTSCFTAVKQKNCGNFSEKITTAEFFCDESQFVCTGHKSLTSNPDTNKKATPVPLKHMRDNIRAGLVTRTI